MVAARAIGAATPSPCSTRPASSSGKVGATTHNRLPATKIPDPVSSTGRRPRLSARGPTNRLETKKPRKFRLRVSCTISSVVPKARRSWGKAGA